MSAAGSAREALIAEAIGDAANLLQQAETVVPQLLDACDALQRADAQLRSTLASLEGQLAAIADAAKGRILKQVAEQIDRKTLQATEQQKQALSEAARNALDSALAQFVVQRFGIDGVRPAHAGDGAARERWSSLLLHVAVAAAAGTTGWLLAAHAAAG